MLNIDLEANSLYLSEHKGDSFRVLKNNKIACLNLCSGNSTAPMKYIKCINILNAFWQFMTIRVPDFKDQEIKP